MESDHQLSETLCSMWCKHLGWLCLYNVLNYSSHHCLLSNVSSWQHVTVLNWNILLMRMWNKRGHRQQISALMRTLLSLWIRFELKVLPMKVWTLPWFNRLLGLFIIYLAPCPGTSRASESNWLHLQGSECCWFNPKGKRKPYTCGRPLKEKCQREWNGNCKATHNENQILFLAAFSRRFGVSGMHTVNKNSDGVFSLSAPCSTL